MILGIDTTDRKKINLKLIDEEAEKCFEFDTENQSADLLIAISGILKKERMTLKNIEAIMVNAGPGSFTGTRVGVTVANTLGWSLRIPVYGFKENEEKKVLKTAKINKKKNFKLALPCYPEKF